MSIFKHVPLAMAYHLQEHGFQLPNKGYSPDMAYINLCLNDTTCIVQAPLAANLVHPGLVPMPTFKQVIDWLRNEHAIAVDNKPLAIDGKMAKVRYFWTVALLPNKEQQTILQEPYQAPEPVWKSLDDDFTIGCINALDYALKLLEDKDTNI